MDTKEAFTHLSNQINWYKLCGIKSPTARSIKRFYKRGHVTQDKIFELLTKAGYLHSEIKWQKPKNNY